MKWFRDYFMGPENKWWDLVRPLVVIAFVLFNVFQWWSLSMGQPFSAMEYGAGCAAFLTLIVGDRFIHRPRRAAPSTGKVTRGE